MLNQYSLFIILLAPVVAYIASAVIFSIFVLLGKDPVCAKYFTQRIFRNGL
jgi:hypothetical protein